MSEMEHVGVRGGDRGTEASAEGQEVGEPDVEPPGDEPTESGNDAEVAEPEEIRLDVIFDILKNQRRRHVLRYLRENETTTLSDLAEHVAALENEKDVQSLTSSERKRVYVGLYQCHLPRMSDAGVIEFDSNRGWIELDDSATQLDEYLDLGTEPRRPWELYQLSIAVGGGLLYGLGSLAFGPQSLFSLAVVPSLVLAVTACAIAQRRSLAEDQDEVEERDE